MGMILFWHKEIAVKTVGPSVRRFYSDYLLFLCFLCILLTFSRTRGISFFRLACWLSKTSKSPQYSQSCSSSKSILQPPTSQSCSLTLTVLGFKTYGMTPRKAAKVTPKRVFRLGKHDFPVFRRVRESVCRSAVMILLWQVRQTTTIWVSLALHAVPTCRTALKAGVREAGE